MAICYNNLNWGTAVSKLIYNSTLVKGLLEKAQVSYGLLYSRRTKGFVKYKTDVTKFIFITLKVAMFDLCVM